MFLDIDKIMSKYRINKYWVINHDMKIYNHSFIDNTMEVSTNYKILNSLFFIYDNLVGKIEFDNISYNALNCLISNYIKNVEMYCESSLLPSEPDIEISSQEDSDDFDLMVDIVSKEIELYTEKNQNIIIEETYIQDKITFYFNYNSYILYNKQSYLNLCLKDFGFRNIVCNKKPYCGILHEVIENEKLKPIADNESILLENKVIKLSHNVFAFIVKLLLQLLDGEQIIRNNSLLSKQDFGKQILRREITIKNFVDNNGFCFDSEGFQMKNKVLINNGILIDCINNIKSGSELKCKSGNSFYDYFLDYCVNKPNKILFEYKENKKPYPEIFAYLFDIKDTQVIIDGDTGYIRLNLLGKGNDGQIMNYHIYRNIFDLINGIVGVSGEQQEHDECIVQEVIIDLGGD